MSGTAQNSTFRILFLLFSLIEFCLSNFDLNFMFIAMVMLTMFCLDETGTFTFNDFCYLAPEFTGETYLPLLLSQML